MHILQLTIFLVRLQSCVATPSNEWHDPAGNRRPGCSNQKGNNMSDANVFADRDLGLMRQALAVDIVRQYRREANTQNRIVIADAVDMQFELRSKLVNTYTDHGHTEQDAQRLTTDRITAVMALARY